MPKNNEDQERLQWLYKGEEGKVFEGEDIKTALAGGWKDAPAKKRGRKPKPDGAPVVGAEPKLEE